MKWAVLVSRPLWLRTCKGEGENMTSKRRKRLKPSDRLDLIELQMCLEAMKLERKRKTDYIS